MTYKQKVLVAIKVACYDGYVDYIERIHTGSEKACMLYKDIIQKEVINIQKIRNQEASGFVHTFGIEYFKDINEFSTSNNPNNYVFSIVRNLLNGYNTKYNLTLTPPHKYDGWELHIV